MLVLVEIRDLLVVAALVAVLTATLVQRRKLTKVQLAVLVCALAVASAVTLADVIWHLEGLFEASIAVLAVGVELLLILAPSSDWPVLYVLFLRIGFGLLALSVSLIALWRISHPLGVGTPHHAAGVLGLAGAILLLIAWGVLRPKRRAWGLF